MNSEFYLKLQRDEGWTAPPPPIAVLWSSVWCGVIYNDWCSSQVTWSVCSCAYVWSVFVWVWLCGGCFSVSKPLVNEDSPHNKRMVLLTSLGMCGLKLNTGWLSGALTYLFYIYISLKTSFLGCPLSQRGGPFPTRLWRLYCPLGPDGGCFVINIFLGVKLSTATTSSTLTMSFFLN